MRASKVLSRLFSFFLVGALGGGLALYGMQVAMGYDPYHWQEQLLQQASEIHRNNARLFALINNICTFLLPAVFCAIVCMKKDWHKMLKINIFSKYSNIFWSIFIMLISIPLIQYTYGINQEMPLPQWMKDAETSTNEFIKVILKADHSYEFWFNLFLFAVIPALSEEFFFRGVLQQQLLRLFTLRSTPDEPLEDELIEAGKYMMPHIAIWLTAFIFSAIHFQFAGFIPRLLLGGVLGYVFYFTGSLWMPIIGHFTNNALMVVGAHLFQVGKSSIDLEKQEFPWYLGIGSLLLTLFSLYMIERNNETYLTDLLAEEDGSDETSMNQEI
jgi:uncharacterized protein